MAKTKKEGKGPGRLKQMWDVFKMTKRLDKSAVWYILAAFLVPVAIGVVLALTFSEGNVFTIVLWVIAGILGGILLALIVLGRRAEKAAYSQIDGQPGAVGAVISGALKKGWRGSDEPIAINGRTHEALYRVIGRGGVVLITEGNRSKTARMLSEEQRTLQRTLPNVAITVIEVNSGEPEQVPLYKLSRRIGKVKRTLTKAEFRQVTKRVEALDRTKSRLPIPKGIDPLKFRPKRSKMR